MDSNLTNLSLGAIVALLIIKEVLAFLRSQRTEKKTNGSSGSLDPHYWRMEFRAAVKECLEPVVSNQKRMEENIGRVEEAIERAGCRWREH